MIKTIVGYTLEYIYYSRCKQLIISLPSHSWLQLYILELKKPNTYVFNLAQAAICFSSVPPQMTDWDLKTPNTNTVYSPLDCMARHSCSGNPVLHLHLYSTSRSKPYYKHSAAWSQSHTWHTNRTTLVRKVFEPLSIRTFKIKAVHNLYIAK